MAASSPALQRSSGPAQPASHTSAPQAAAQGSTSHHSSAAATTQPGNANATKRRLQQANRCSPNLAGSSRASLMPAPNLPVRQDQRAPGRGCARDTQDLPAGQEQAAVLNQPWWIASVSREGAEEAPRMAQLAVSPATSLQAVSQISRSHASSKADGRQPGSSTSQGRRPQGREAKHGQAGSDTSQSTDRQAACMTASRAASSANLMHESGDQDHDMHVEAHGASNGQKTGAAAAEHSAQKVSMPIRFPFHTSKSCSRC